MSSICGMPGAILSTSFRDQRPGHPRCGGYLRVGDGHAAPSARVGISPRERGEIPFVKWGNLDYVRQGHAMVFFSQSLIHHGLRRDHAPETLQPKSRSHQRVLWSGRAQKPRFVHINAFCVCAPPRIRRSMPFAGPSQAVWSYKPLDDVNPHIAQISRTPNRSVIK